MDVVPHAASSETIRTADGLVITAYGLTDIGCKRSVNQDTLGNRIGQVSAEREQRGLLYAVADGMGGHAHGEVASAIAIDTIFAHYYATERAEGIPRTLDSAMRATNSAVYEAGRAAGGGTMGTTLTSVVLHGKVLYVGNIGDSRTYLIRGGRIKQLTQDHSLVGEQLRLGLLTEEQARASTIRNVITRAVGHDTQVEPDVFVFTVEAGDRLLLCSDGLHGLVENAELAQTLGTGPLDEAVRALIALARARGGPDNITALALSIDQLGTAAESASDRGSAPIVIGAGDDTPRVLPRLDDVELVDAAPRTPDKQPTVPGVLAARPSTAPPAPPPSAARPNGAAVGAPAPAKPTAPPARAAPKAASRAPMWLFVIVPIVIVALLVAGSFFLVGARRGDRQEAAQPVGAGASAATSTATVAPTAVAPAVAPTTPPTATPPAPTTTPIAIEGRLPTAASTPTATKEGGFVAPALPPRASASPTSVASAAANGQTAVGGTVTIENGVVLPDDFPDRWEVFLYDQAEWQRDQRTATPRANARLERPLGQNTPAEQYTFRITLTPPAAGGTYIVQLRHVDGTSAATIADGPLSLAIGAAERVKEFSFRVTGFGGGAEIGR